MGGQPHETEAVPICLNCASPLSRGEHFCKQCGAPATSAAMSMPYESVLARGFAARQASSRPRKLIVVIGMWLWLGPTFIFLLIASLGVLFDARGLAWQPEPIWPIVGHLAAFVVCGALATVPGTLLYKTTRNYIRRPRDDDEQDGDGARNKSD
jgi:hypothetical protein